MIKLKKIDNNDTNGFSLILLWILGLNIVHSTSKGRHMQIGLALGPFETTFGISLWGNMLP